MTVKTRHLFCKHLISLVKKRRINYNLTLKGHVESLTLGQGHDLIRKSHVACQSTRIVGLNIFIVFSSLQLVSIKSYCRKTAGDLPWPEMTLTTWRGVTGHNIPTQGVKSTCNSMFESVLNGFRPKQAPFNFLQLTYNGEVAKLVWPWITNIKISRYTFHKFIDTVTDINRCKFQGDRSFGVAMMNIKTFSEVRSLAVTWWPDLECLGLKLSQYVRKRCMNRCAKNYRRFFIYQQNMWGSNTHPPACAG